MQSMQRETEGEIEQRNKLVNGEGGERSVRGKSEMLRENPISYYLIIAAPGGCNRIHNHCLHWIYVFSFCFFPSLNVKLSHDATCVPSTCSDNDGHPERSSTIVPGEPTGQRFHQNLHSTHGSSSGMNVKGVSQVLTLRYMSSFYLFFS